MKNKNISIGALLALVAVILGAFGAHTLKTYLTTEQLATFEVGVRYQMYHALALILVGILQKENTGKQLNLTSKFFIVGILLFSGSLYLLTALKLNNTVGHSGIGAITPIGGLFFIGGWGLLCYSSWKK